MFEDANDEAVIEVARTATVERTRSLTKRRSSSVKSQLQETSSDPPPVPAVPEKDINGDTSHDKHDTRQPKSPLLTSHRLSTTSLDNVNLDEDGERLKPST